MAGNIQDRVKELRRVRGCDLVHDADNPSIHPQEQIDAMEAVLKKIGFASAALAYELPDGRLKLFDGHMRSRIADDQVIPVLVTDLTPEEAAQQLATFDSLGRLKKLDRVKFDELVTRADFDDGAIAAMLAKVQMQIQGRERDAGEKIEQKKLADCHYPIAPNFAERYSYVLVYTKSELEWAHLQTILGLTRQRNAKNSFTGIGQVVSFADFVKLWQARHPGGEPPIPDGAPGAGS